MLPFRSSLAGIVWPAITPPPGAALLSLLFQLEQSQWLSPDALVGRQFAQLGVLADFLWQASPFYRTRLEASGWSPGKPLNNALWQSLPVLERATVQAEKTRLIVATPPPAHGRPMEYATTGSLGIPVQGLGNELTHLFNSALIVRNHLWHRRDLGGKFAAIRSKVKSGSYPNWGTVEAAAFVTGPGVVLDIATEVERQLDWLIREAPRYLLTHPSNLRSLLILARKGQRTLPSLKEVATFGEMLPDDLRSLARSVWNVPLVDLYSSEEFGTIALQCPQHPEHYHIQSENMLLEIVDEKGASCAPGQVGRVLISTLHNFTMPLLRYAIGDYAEAGPQCPCGRGLPTIRRIVGRRRNMLRRPDGGSHWPSFPYEDLQPIGDFRQIRIVQHTRHELEVHLARPEPLSAAAEALFSARLCALLHGHFSIRYAYPASIPASPGGKFEDFVSLLDD
jgi:phenylacetate-CoA ligase